jgi:hypothetical protein
MREHRLHPLLHLPAVGRVQLLLQAAHAAGELLVLRRVREGMRDRVPVVQQPRDLRQATGNHVLDVQVEILVDVLREGGDAHSRAHPQPPRVRRCKSPHQPQEGGFTGAVASHDAHPFARLDLQRSVVEQGQRAKSETHVIKTKEGISCSSHPLL